MEFEANTVFKPDTSEHAAISNTSPEALQPLVMGWLQTMTGLSWEVRVKHVPMDNMGDRLVVHAEVIMSIDKDKLGTEPEFTITKTPEKTEAI